MSENPISQESKAHADSTPPSQEGHSSAQADMASATDAASDDAAALASELMELKTKNAELADLYLRAQADVQNARRRADDEVAKARKFAVEGFAESLLPVLDSLEAGLALSPGATVDQVREGAEATLRQLKSALERNKVLEINPAPGSKFDPHQQQAISVVPSPEGQAFAPNSIVTVLQKGYVIADRVMRPALVTVTASG